MAKRRRGARATWLPIDPTYWGESEKGTTFFTSTVTLPSGSEAGDSTIVATPLVLDQTQEIDTTDPGVSMRDLVEGQEYLLQRVVGQVWMAMEQGATTAFAFQARNVLSAITLAVLPVEDDNPSVPAMPPEDYNPLFAANTMQPWLWRRTWTLGNALVDSSFRYPRNTAEYGSGNVGGFLDTKGTVRRIRKEQRLFLIAAAGLLSTSSDPTTVDTFVQFGCDLRCLGGMRRARNISTFK